MRFIGGALFGLARSFVPNANMTIILQKLSNDKNFKQGSKDPTQVNPKQGQIQDQASVNTLRQRRNVSGQPTTMVCTIIQLTGSLCCIILRTVLLQFMDILIIFQFHNQPSSLPGSPYRTAVVPSGNISEGSGDRPTISDNKETYSSGPMTPGSLQRISSQGTQRRK